MGDNAATPTTSAVDNDLLLKQFFAEVSEVERDNEVARFELSISFSSMAFLLLLCNLDFSILVKVFN